MVEAFYEIFPGVNWGFRAPISFNGDPFPGFDVVLPQQTHTANVGVLDRLGMAFPETDALVTQVRGVRIGIRTADCVPIVVYCHDIGAIAAIHAGWKGTIAHIATNTIDRLCGLGARCEEMRVFFGPAICADCFEVDAGLARMFEAEGFAGCVRECRMTDPLTGKAMDSSRPHIDLVGCNIRLFLQAGVRSDCISDIGMCTRHACIDISSGGREMLPSWRRESGTSRRLITWIGMDAGR